MKKIFLLAAFFVGATASAGIEQGTWVGAGGGCSMEVGPQTFEGNMRHPLNERIQIKVDQYQFSIHHPAVIDEKTATASFNHDLFEGVIPTKTGAVAIVVTLTHTPEFEGPTQFTIIEDNWKTGVKTAKTCANISHSKISHK